MSIIEPSHAIALELADAAIELADTQAAAAAAIGRARARLNAATDAVQKINCPVTRVEVGEWAYRNLDGVHTRRLAEAVMGRSALPTFLALVGSWKPGTGLSEKGWAELLRGHQRHLSLRDKLGVNELAQSLTAPEIQSDELPDRSVADLPPTP